MRYWCCWALLLVCIGCTGGGSSYEDPRPKLATMPPAARENILGIVDSAKGMSSSEATAFMEEQLPTFEQYTEDPESPYADLYQQILNHAQSVAAGQEVKQSLKEVEKLAKELPAKAE